MADEGKLKNCQIKLKHEVKMGSGRSKSTSRLKAASQCADWCSTRRKCKGFRFDPLSNNKKCTVFTDPLFSNQTPNPKAIGFPINNLSSVFSKDENSTVAVGWCPKGKVFVK